MLAEEDFAGAAELSNSLLRHYPHALAAWRGYILSNLANNHSFDQNGLSEAAARLGVNASTGELCFAGGYLKYQQRNFEDAFTTLQSCAPGIRQADITRNLLAAIAGERGDIEKALRILTQLLKEEPDFELAQNNARHQIQMLLAPTIHSILESPLSSRNASIATIKRRATLLEKRFPAPGSRVSIHFSSRMDWRHSLGIVSVTVGEITETTVYRSGIQDAIEQLDRADNDTSEGVLDESYSPKMVFYSCDSVSGTHDSLTTLIAIPAEGPAFTISREWQNSGGNFVIVDLDKDGMPEILEDRSDYYVYSYADGIVNFSYNLLVFNPDRSSFSYQRFGLPESTNAEVVDYSATGLEALARGRWNEAVKDFEQAARIEPASKTAKWNLLLSRYHLRLFEKQYRQRPSAVTALLLGDGRLLAPRKDVMRPLGLSGVPVVNLLQMAFDDRDGGMRAVRSQLYIQRRSANDMLSKPIALAFSEIAQQRTGGSGAMNHVFVYPELRALENGVIARQKGAVFYAEPGVSSQHLLKELTSSATGSAEYIYSPFSSHSIYGLSRTFASVSYETSLMAEPTTPETLLIKIDNLAYLEDYEAASEALDVYDRLANRPLNEDVDRLAFERRLIDSHLGRDYDALSSLLTASFTAPLDNEIYEHLNMPNTALQGYRRFTSAKCSDKSQGVSDLLTCIDALIGVGRNQLALGNLEVAEKSLLHAKMVLEALIESDRNIEAYGNTDFAHMLTLLARVELRMGHISAARGYNALAHYAVVRGTDPGRGQIESSFYYHYPAFTQLLLTDFQIAKATNDHASAVGYLAAALSVVRDLQLCSTSAGNRFGIGATEHEILAEAGEFFIESNEPGDALLALNQMRDSSATRRVLETQSVAGLTPEFTMTEMNATIERLQSEGTALLQFAVLGGRVYAIVVPATKGSRISVVRLQLTAVQLAALVEDVEDEITGPDSMGEAPEAKRTLSSANDALITPIEPALLGAKSLLIVPDGDLYRLPFAALRDPAGRYLVEKYTVAYAGSLQGLRNRTNSVPEIKSIVVAHSPITTTAQTLRYGKTELDSIRKELPWASLRELAGAQLTRSSVAHEVLDADLVHISSHAFVDSTSPEKSYLVLNEGNSSNGTFSVRDIIAGNLRFNHKPLVVLAACSSGTGRVFDSGLFGFGYALALAGAGPVVMTRWEIEDAFGAKFAQLFYHSLATKQAPESALAIAQRAMIPDVPVGQWATFFEQRAY